MSSWSTVMIMPRIPYKDIEVFDNYETFLAHYMEHALTSQEEQDIGEALDLDFHETMFFIVKMDNVLLDEGDHLDNTTLQGMTRGTSRGSREGRDVKGRVWVNIIL